MRRANLGSARLSRILEPQPYDQPRAGPTVLGSCVLHLHRHRPGGLADHRFFCAVALGAARGT